MCFALLILPEILHHLCLYCFDSEVSPNDLNYLKAHSNIVQHISDCGRSSNTKSLYCLCFHIAFCRWRAISLNIFLHMCHAPVEAIDQLRPHQSSAEGNDYFTCLT